LAQVLAQEWGPTSAEAWALVLAEDLELVSAEMWGPALAVESGWALDGASGPVSVAASERETVRVSVLKKAAGSALA